ncbi:MAG: transcriptional regulator [Alphaproteobacteria bacterium]|nr:transcriptional regulator [Alphaproteobacteria bacterium]
MLPLGSKSPMVATPPSNGRSAVDLARSAARATGAASSAPRPYQDPLRADGRHGQTNLMTPLSRLRDADETIQPAIKLSDLRRRAELDQVARDSAKAATARKAPEADDAEPAQSPDAPNTGLPTTANDRTIDSARALGQIVREARERHGLSQQMLADQAEVGRRFVSELENGKATIALDKTLKVAGAVGVQLVAITSP